MNFSPFSVGAILRLGICSCVLRVLQFPNKRIHGEECEGDVRTLGTNVVEIGAVIARVAHSGAYIFKG